jgi:general secretion pathway protein H
VWRPTSSTRSNRSGEGGFTLLEALCFVAIVALLWAIGMPALPRATSRPQLEAYAVAAASLLQLDRTAAARRQMSIATTIDVKTRSLRAGAMTRVVQLPQDVALEALLPQRCNHYANDQTIRFFPSGMSCGGVLTFARGDIGYQVRVNWLTGGIDIVPHSRT